MRHRRHRIRVATLVIDPADQAAAAAFWSAALDTLVVTGDPDEDHGAFMLQDPAGNRFCVIYPETPGWPQGTRTVAGATAAGR